jgi:hypothetical protein
MISNLRKVKYIPTWFPGMGFKSRAELWKKEMEDVVDYCYTTTMLKKVSKTSIYG